MYMYIYVYICICIHLHFYYTYRNTFFHHIMRLLDLDSQKLTILIKIYSNLWYPSRSVELMAYSH